MGWYPVAITGSAWTLLRPPTWRPRGAPDPLTTFVIYSHAFPSTRTMKIDRMRILQDEPRRVYIFHRF
jgi:hypothetical protein